MTSLTDHPPVPPAAPARLRRLLALLDIHPADGLALVMLAAGATAALVLLWAAAGSPPTVEGPVGLEVEEPPLGVTVGAADVVVHVAGLVARPGVYRLQAGARVSDALDTAGGALPEADLAGLNLARPLSDGEQVMLAAPGAPTAPQSGAPPHPARRPDGTLDLNLATAKDLEELPGIGPVLAERIVAHRETIGRFSEIGQLRDVSGIGEKTFQRLAPLVSV